MSPKFEETINQRITTISSWLKESAPHVFDEQEHLDEGKQERAYWHYGYMVALRDIQNMIHRGDDT